MSQKGFAPIIFVLGILALLVGLVGGSLYIKNNVSKRQSTVDTSSPPVSIIYRKSLASPSIAVDPSPSIGSNSNLKLYIDKVLGISFSYPSSWQLKIDKENNEYVIRLYPPSGIVSIFSSDQSYDSSPSPRSDMTSFKPINIDGVKGRYTETSTLPPGAMRLPTSDSPCQEDYEINLPYKEKTLVFFTCKELKDQVQDVLNTFKFDK